jgi:enoyl-CoA hydratase
MIAAVQGACIAGGLMLAWVCDLIVASDDAFFMDPVLRMGIPGVEYFAHPWEVGPRAAKEMLFLAEPIRAERALALGMVTRVVERDALLGEALGMADRIAELQPLGLALAKRAVNQAEDLMGLRAGMDAAFGLHHVAHAHNAETSTDHLAGQDPRSMKAAASS